MLTAPAGIFKRWLSSLSGERAKSIFVVRHWRHAAEHQPRLHILTPTTSPLHRHLHYSATAPLPCASPLPRAAGFPSYDSLFNHVAGALFSSLVSSNENGRRDHDHHLNGSTRCLRWSHRNHLYHACPPHIQLLLLFDCFCCLHLRKAS
jgi:hypothetical protein